MCVKCAYSMMLCVCVCVQYDGLIWLNSFLLFPPLSMYMLFCRSVQVDSLTHLYTCVCVCAFSKPTCTSYSTTCVCVCVIDSESITVHHCEMERKSKTDGQRVICTVVHLLKYCSTLLNYFHCATLYFFPPAKSHTEHHIEHLK